MLLGIYTLPQNFMSVQFGLEAKKIKIKKKKKLIDGL